MTVQIELTADEQRLAQNDHRPNLYFDETRGDDGLFVIRCSTINTCTRSLVADALEFERQPPPDNILVRMNESTLLEAPLMERLKTGDYEWYGSRVKGTIQWEHLNPNDQTSYRATGPFIVHPGDGIETHEFRVNIPVGREAVVSGGIDSIAAVFTRPTKFTLISEDVEFAVVEGKNLGPDLFKKFMRSGIEGMPQYLGQTCTYVAGAKAGHANPESIVGLFAVGEKLYDNDGKPYIGRVVVQVLGDDLPVKIGQVKKRALEIMKAVNVGLDTNELPAKCDTVVFPCPHYMTHDDDSSADGAANTIVVDEIPDAERRELLEYMLKEYRKAQLDEQRAKALKDFLSPQIRDELILLAGKSGTMKYGDLTVSHTYKEWDEYVEPPKPERVVKAGVKSYITMNGPKVETDITKAVEALNTMTDGQKDED